MAGLIRTSPNAKPPFKKSHERGEKEKKGRVENTYLGKYPIDNSVCKCMVAISD